MWSVGPKRFAEAPAAIRKAATIIPPSVALATRARHRASSRGSAGSAGRIAAAGSTAESADAGVDSIAGADRRAHL